MKPLLSQLLFVFLAVLCGFGESWTSLHAQSFNSTGLVGASVNNPTSLQFGPDDRLYVAQQDGTIKVFTVQQSGSNYSVTSTETITTIRQVLNHQDTDGSIYFGAQSRQVTGILVTGTASTPILYVPSSDYRIGGGGGGSDLNLDTNSGILHKLTKTPNGWQRLDLVRGLPRSEENHASNGMQLSPGGQTLYLAQGGHTNAGAPSNNFAFTTEYALSAAVLAIDLSAINAMPTKTWAEDGSKYKYDLPTLDDPTRPNQNGQDVGDPFGGNDGLNQAKLVAGGPVQVYAPGFRNLYDLVLTQDNKLYGWDNGPNGGWGGHPANEGLGTATNNWLSGEPGSTGPGPNDPQVNNLDGLHFITGPGYYGGHPNPIRANPNGAGLFTQSGNGGGHAGTWRTSTSGANPLPSDWPPVPNSLATPIEGDYQNPGETDPSIYTVMASTNGMCEYTSTANSGQLQGDLLAASFNGKLYRVKRNAAGGINSASDVSVLAENFGSVPLDVTAQGDGQIFPGTIWAATYGADNITVFTPTGSSGCNAANSAVIDSDGDGYSNADEYANNTNPCSQASTPPDHDQSLIGLFKVSDLNDPDDDDDGLPDNSDPFALDASNGLNTILPLDLPLLNGTPGTGFYGVGFTGLMTNGLDYRDNIADESNSTTEIIAGGAVGLFTINNQGSGDAYLANDQLKNGFQLGFPLTQNSPVTTLETKLLGPIWSSTPVNYQQAGFALSDGTQDTYLKIVPIQLNGTVVQVQYQESDVDIRSESYMVAGLTTAAEIRLYLSIDPAAGTVQPGIDVGSGYQSLGTAVQLQGNLLARVQDAQAPAVTLMVTSATPGLTMNATYDYIRIDQAVTNNFGTWTTIDGGGGCAAMGQAGSCAQGRHEASYVQVGDKFYLLGGREHGSNVNIYTPATDTWTVGASPGFPVHHFQAVAFEGLIYAVGVFKDNNFPTEQPYERVLIYDPVRDRWFDGPTIPAARRRGSAACVVHQGKIYVAGGITNGHTSGWSNKFDCFDPATANWNVLPNLPRARDHFHAAVANGQLVVAGGRRSGQQSTFLPTVPQVDVYDFGTASWSTWANNLPTQRAAPAVAVLGGELLVIGGERNGGAANNEVEALNLSTQTWRTLSPLNQGRHGTQAIINNGAVYVAAGSPIQGGGSTRTQERFTLNGGAPLVTGQVLAQAQLAAPNSLSWSNLSNGQSLNKDLVISHAGGNQGAVVEAISISGTGWSLPASTAEGRLIAVGSNLVIPVRYTASATAATTGVLSIQTSAAAQALVVQLSASNTPPPSGTSVFINVGGPAVTTGGIAYGADQYASASNLSGTSAAIAGTNNDIIYQTNRWNNGNINYNIPVPNGEYDVTLHFAENYFVAGANGGPGVGKRIFNVQLESLTVLNNFDINAVTGASVPTAVARTFRTSVTDANIDLDFIQGAANNPLISAIDIVPASSPPTPASLSLNPSSLAFQTQVVGSTSAPATVTLTNAGGTAAQVTSVQLSGPQGSAFAKTGIGSSTTIAANSAINFQVSFSPSSAQPAVQQGVLTINFAGGLPSLTLPLTGEAAQPTTGGGFDLEMAASSTVPNPGQWQVAAGRFTLTNTGNAGASGIRVRLALPANMVFEGGNEATASQGSFDPYAGAIWTVGTLAAGATATLDYRVFNKSTAAQRVDAWVSAHHGSDVDSSPSAAPDGEDDGSCFEFNGSGACSSTPTTPMAQLSVSPANVVFPATLPGQSASRTVTITNSGSADATVDVRTLGSPNPGQFAFTQLANGTTISAGNSHAFQVTFAPTAGTTGSKRSTLTIGFGGSIPNLAVNLQGTVASQNGGSNDADLELTASSTTPNPGQWFTAPGRFTLTNAGGSAATNIRVQLRLPVDFVYVGGNEATTSQGSFDPYTGGIWTVGTLAAGATATIEYNIFNKTTAAQTVLGWVSAQTGADADSSPSANPDGEDDAACFEYNGSATACTAASSSSLAIANFNAQPRSRMVETYWRVDFSDQRERVYTVERLLPGGTWTELGTATPTREYLSVWDERPALGRNLYRLITTYADGTREGSAERLVEFEIDLAAIDVFPNPSRSQLMIYVPRTTAHTVEVMVANSLGQVMRRAEFADAQTDQLVLEHDWPAGIYHVYVQVGGLRRAFGVHVVD